MQNPNVGASTENFKTDLQGAHSRDHVCHLPLKYVQTQGASNCIHLEQKLSHTGSVDHASGYRVHQECICHFYFLFFPLFLNLNLIPWNYPVRDRSPQMQGRWMLMMSFSFRSLQISWWPWGYSASTLIWRPSISWSLIGRPCTTLWR